MQDYTQLSIEQSTMIARKWLSSGKMPKNHEFNSLSLSLELLRHPIERLWAIAKRSFSRDCITEADYDNYSMIKALVMKSILEASSVSLNKHIFACVRLMQNDIN